MKVAEALPKISVLCGKLVSTIVTELPSDLTTNKGNVGQILERYLGLRGGSAHTDFEDGELKTKSSKERTFAITQIANDIDNLLAPNPVAFERSKLYAKIRNLVIVEVIKSGTEPAWRVGHGFHVVAAPASQVFAQLKKDYETICAGLRRHVNATPGAFIHTTNGEFIQVRSKDSEPYHPIKSTLFRRAVSDKNHAFYFLPKFMTYLASRDDFRLCKH